jgi:hypothetical protein
VTHTEDRTKGIPKEIKEKRKEIVGKISLLVVVLDGKREVFSW